MPASTPPPRKNFHRQLRALSLGVTTLLWALVLLGAECSPSEPGCGADDCGTEEVGQCINFCAPIATAEEIAAGRVLCPLDPCDEAAVTLPDAFVCPTSFRCTPRALLPGDDPRLGYCAAALRTQYGLECEAVGECGEGLLCRKGGSVEALALADLMGRDPFESGVCLPPVRESGACDSNLADFLIATPVDLPEAPCEHGTFCMPGSLGGLDTDDDRCIRPCGVDGEADHTICGCDETLCVERGEFVREATGESLGAHFCIPCTANREECTSVDRCCDEQGGATCMPAPRFGVLVDEGEIDQCCRPDETECEVDSECCHGSLCLAGVCSSCGRAGETPQKAGCCPGTTPLTTAEGTRCGLCTDFPSDARRPTLRNCGGGQLLLENAQGAFDSVPISGAVWATPPYWEMLTETSSGGDLVEAERDVANLRYSLPQTTRAFLFSEDLTTGVSGGLWGFLPQDDAGPIESLPVRFGRDLYESVRVFDAGACSYVVGYGQLAEAVGASLVTQLANIEELASSVEIDELLVNQIAVTPVLRSTPRYPLTASIGPELPIDGLKLDISLDIDIRAQGPLGAITHDCGRVTLALRPTIDFSVTDSFLVPPATRARDEEFQDVGCNLNRDSTFTCILPDPDDPSRPVVEDTFAFCHSALDPHDCQREMMGVGCTINTNSYSCTGPLPLLYDGDPLSLEDYPSLLSTLVIPREVDVVAHAKDLVVDIRIPDEAMDFSSVNDACNLAGGQVKTQIRRAAARAESALADQIANLIGTIVGGPTIGGNRLRATRDFGVPVASIPTCRNDDECHRTTFLGDRRHSCDTQAGICDFVRMEFRRIHFRPDGIEIVLAENATDPHFALINDGRAGPRQTALDVPPALCAALRYSNPPAFGLRTAQILPTNSIFATGRLCQEEEVACLDLCPSLGIDCANAVALGLATANSSCNSGECCPSEPDCAGTGICACSGTCTDLGADPSHCGGCGSACAPGFRCIGGSCALP